MNQSIQIPLESFLTVFNSTLALASKGDEHSLLLAEMLSDECDVSGEIVTLPVTLWNWAR